MINVSDHAHLRHQDRPPSRPKTPMPPPCDTGITHEEFYRDMVSRPDIREILTRLAQIQDDGAK